MAWWVWAVAAATLLAGLDLIVQWARVRLTPARSEWELRACPTCGTAVPAVTWRCYQCGTWVRRRIPAAILGVLRIPAFVGGFVLMFAALLLFGLFWLLLLIVGPLGRLRPVSALVRAARRAWRSLQGQPGRWVGSREGGTYWSEGGRLLRRYLIPWQHPSPGGSIGELLETAIGDRELPGAWRGAVVWLREPDAVVDGAFLAGTHLTEVGAAGSWIDRGDFHRVELAPIRDWVGWRGTRQDLEALGDRYLFIAGGVGLVAVGTAADRPPPSWGAGSGEAPQAWVRVYSTHGGRGWEVGLHWDLPFEPEDIPDSIAITLPES